MTDPITPASLRAHADWFDTTFEPGSVEARSLRNCAARLEAESARDEEALKYAQVYRRAQRRVYPTLAKWGSLDAETQENYTRPMRAVLDRLAADGRLLPEGGMVLDAGQWAMVRTLIEASHRKPEVQRAADRLRDEFKVGRCRCGGLIVEPSPGCEWHSAREVTPPAVSVPDSAPDGTPEKPWPTWQQVPEGVVYRGTHRDGSPTESRWMNRGGECWVVDGRAATHPESYRLVNSVAPFVRVDGDKA